MKSSTGKNILISVVAFHLLLVIKSIHGGGQHIPSAFSSPKFSSSPERTTTTSTITKFTPSSPFHIITYSHRRSSCTTSTAIDAIDNKNASENDKVKTDAIRFRPGRKSDEITMKLLMTRNLMNPLNINHERFIVAVNPSNDNDIYGFAQLRALGGRSGSTTRDPNTFDSMPGSSTASAIMKDELNEMMYYVEIYCETCGKWD